MKIKLSCMNCSCLFETDVSQSGKEGLRCPKCHKEFVIEMKNSQMVNMQQKSNCATGHNYKILS